MEITKGERLLLCALPQPGWGGCTLAGYVEGIGLREDVNGTEQQCATVLDGLVAMGHVRPVEVAEGEHPRWELTPVAHDALIAPIEPEAGRSVTEVFLAMQPGVALSGAASEQEVQS
jgi:hypothetical protein